MTPETQKNLRRQIAAVKKAAGKNLTEEAVLYQGETQWRFQGDVIIGVKEIMRYDGGGAWHTGRVAVYVKADVGKPSRWGGRQTVSRQYSSKDCDQNTRKALTTAREFALMRAEDKTAEHTRDVTFGVEVERVKHLLGGDLPSWARFKPTTEGKIQFSVGTRTVTPEQACAIIQTLEVAP